MTEEQDKAYDPKATEERIYKFWEEGGYFQPEAGPPPADNQPKKLPAKKSRSAQQVEDPRFREAKSGLKSYAIHLPPPNVTGSLHMGHALNVTITDILVRYHRMRGDKTVWFPGTDHAGIATQNVVEKDLKKQGISRWDLGREKFIEKVWEWKEKYGNIIIEQIKKLGASCDWSRLRFTMDPIYAEEVKKSFIHYYEKGLIYRGKRIVSWCVACQTSLSDLEVEYKEESGKLWYIRYPLVEGLSVVVRKTKTKNGTGSDNQNQTSYIVVATTRPETMLGDAAVAVNPKDERYTKLIGKSVTLPLVNRDIPIIADDAIDMNFGTGAVKVTPAHDLLDAEIAERHQLEPIDIIDERGRMTAAAGEKFKGLKVLEAREKVVKELEGMGLLEKTEDYKHNVAICYRSGTVLEPLRSNQWFLRMASHAQNKKSKIKDKNLGMSLRDMVLKTFESGKTKIIPENFEKILTAWMENIKDWCISRQIWWGHQLPVYFCENKQEVEIKDQKSKIKNNKEYFVVGLEKPQLCPFCKNCDMRQSEDVLDTWFSSALWPFAGLSENDLKDFYPSNILITARDIINLWVARMIFSGLEFMKETPFPEVLIHATILTKEGQRMSKSKGTGIDPLGLIDKYGADATRFGIIWQTMGTQDVHWDETAVMAGKKFANKIWNINRFCLSKIGNLKFKIENLKLTASEDREILAKFKNLKIEVEKDVEKYELGPALHKIYDFIWHEFADKYIELSKAREDENAKMVLGQVLADSLKLLHPFMPFITEEIYQRISAENHGALIIEKWS